MSEVTITTPQGDLGAYEKTPSGSGPWPGVVVVHDAFGMTQDLRNQVDWLADEGFVAVAPDLFRGRGKLSCTVKVMREVRARTGATFDDIEAVREWLATRDDCTGRVGVIGFCMGGGLAMVLAPEGRFDAASINYGAAPKAAFSTAALSGACPIVASYGVKDVSLRGAAARLEGALTEAGVAHDVKQYPEAGHGFLNDHVGAGDKMPPIFTVFAKLAPGMGYHEESARDARERIAAFLNAHLTAEPADA